MKSRSKERLPERVPFTAIPTGETLNLFTQAGMTHLGTETKDIAQWAHRLVWTDRMLETLLNNQVKGGKWHALFDKVFRELNLFDSARKVLKKEGAAGVDQQSVTDFAEHERDEIRSLHEELREGRYRPSPVRRVWIPKPGSQEQRPLGIPTVRDRVVQTALVHVIEPILDHTFHERSFGFRRGRGCHDALRVVEEKLEAGYVYVVDADLKGYILMSCVSRKVHDRRLLRLIGRYLRAGVLVEGVLQPTPEGSPQGGPLSPLLSNVLLDDLDKELERRGLRFVRYADDFMIFVRSERSAQRVFASVQRFLTQRLKLVVNEQKSSVRPAQGCEYLGFTFIGKRVTIKVSPKKLKAFKRRIKELTGRSRGISMTRRLTDLNRYVRGWIGYFGLARQFDEFVDLDGWIRRRVRMCYWKQWRYARTKVRNLMQLGVNLDWAIKHATSRKKYWRMSRTPALRTAMPNKWLEQQGLLSLKQLWSKLAPLRGTA